MLDFHYNETVYNLTVANTSSHFVRVDGVLVHYVGCPEPMDAWLQRELYQELPKLVGQADFRKWVAALKKGLVGPINQAGIKKLNPKVKRFHPGTQNWGKCSKIIG